MIKYKPKRKMTNFMKHKTIASFRIMITPTTVSKI